MENNFKIAIIDSGVDKEHPRLKKCKITGLTLVKNSKGIDIIEDQYFDTFGHGTAIAGIIHKILPENELVAIKLDSVNNIIDEILICAAIELCISNGGIKIINISLGVSSKNPLPKLSELCKKAYENRIYIVAAVHNKAGNECYPAFFNTVFSVASGLVKNHLEYGIAINKKVNFIAKGTTQRIAWLNKGYRITSGTSYAAPHFTGILARVLMKNHDLSNSELYQKLIEGATPGIQQINDFYNPDTSYKLNEDEIPDESIIIRLFSQRERLWFANNIALFPICEKEFSTVLNFKDFCSFNIVKLFDYPRNFTLKIDKYIANIEIKTEIDNKDFDEFDTIVMGYFLSQMFDANILFGFRLVEKALLFNKNFIVWDANVFKYIKNESLKYPYKGVIYYPFIGPDIYKEVMKNRYLPNISVPVLLVIGTSNKQGKITTQMRLREILTSEGYRVSHISTEPQGEILGSDFTFPFGHLSTVAIKEEFWGEFMHTVVKAIDHYKKPHIIISGTQGCFLPRNYSVDIMTSMDLLSPIHYLSGIMPDAIICAVNPEDKIEHINNILHIIKMFSRAKLLFFVMNPLTRNYHKNGSISTVEEKKIIDNETLKIHMKEMENILGYPVINIMDTMNNGFILNCIENAFSPKV